MVSNLKSPLARVTRDLKCKENPLIPFKNKGRLKIMFKVPMLSRYKRLTEFFKKQGILIVNKEKPYHP